MKPCHVVEVELGVNACLQNNLLESDKKVRREDARCCENQSTVPFFLLYLHN
jgi:hypothetical protein